jgi:hypothetical protein
MTEETSTEEKEARAIIEGKGFRPDDYILEYNSGVLEGLRWKCRVGRLKNFGRTPLDAVLRLLANNPVPPRHA